MTRTAGEINLFMAVAAPLPDKDVLQATNDDSNSPSGSIAPTAVYLSPLTPAVIAKELWGLWDCWIPVPQGVSWESVGLLDPRPAN